MLGEPVLVGRGKDGKVFAFATSARTAASRSTTADSTARRSSAPITAGATAATGGCVAIPSLTADQRIDLSKIRCGAYPCVERQGLVWVYFPRTSEAPRRGGGAAEDAGLRRRGRSRDHGDLDAFACSTDHAAFGLMDPTHAAYVHTSWWFKRQAPSQHREEKSFEPAGLGCKMARHVIPPTRLIYKLLGKNVSTEITYRLPGIRIEEVHGDKHSLVGLTAMTPITDEATEVHQMFWTTPAWVKPLAPIVGEAGAHLPRPGPRRRRPASARAWSTEPKVMLINDANTQARWWMHVKDEWVESRQGRPPLPQPAEAEDAPLDELRTFRMNTMVKTDIAALEKDLLARIDAAADEAALEAERVAALGKKGAVSDLLKGLGAMTPEERQVMGPALNGLRDRVHAGDRRPPRRAQGGRARDRASRPSGST